MLNNMNTSSWSLYNCANKNDLRNAYHTHLTAFQFPILFSEETFCFKY